MGGRDQSERLVAINRNRWSQSAGAPRQNSKGRESYRFCRNSRKYFQLLDWKQLLFRILRIQEGRWWVRRGASG
jgi:hypothetical protein